MTTLTVDRFLTGSVLVVDYWVNQNAGPVISAVGQVQDGAAFTVTGTNFSGSGNTILLIQGSDVLEITPTSEGTTSATTPNLNALGFFLTQPAVVIVQNAAGVQSPPFNLPLNADGRTYIKPATGSSAWSITQSVQAASDKRLSFSPDLAPGMEVGVLNITGPGTSSTSVVVNPDGTFITAADVSGTPRVDSFDVWGQDGSLRSASATMLVIDPVTTINVPNEVGQTIAFATSDLQGLGITLHIQGYAQSFTFPKGTVISTFPAAGQPQVVGGKVEVIVSLGSDQTLIPSMIGLQRTIGESARTAALLSGRSLPYIDGFNNGVIVGQSVTAGTQVAVNSTVDISYSSNILLDVRKAQLNQAVSDLASCNLVVNPLIATISGGVAGTIASQSPLQGSVVSPGDTISLTVYTGVSVVTDQSGVSGSAVSGAGVSGATVSGDGVEGAGGGGGGSSGGGGAPSTIWADIWADIWAAIWGPPS